MSISTLKKYGHVSNFSFQGNNRINPVKCLVNTYVNVAYVELRMLSLVAHRTNMFKTESKIRIFTFRSFHDAVCGAVRCREKCLDSGTARLEMRPIQPTVQSVQVAISLMLKPPLGQTDHFPSSIEVNNELGDS